MTKDPAPLLVCGTRSLAIEVADILSDIDAFDVQGFVENFDQSIAGTTIEGLPVYWVDDIAEMAETHLALCALATTHRSKFTARVQQLGFCFATVIHPSAQIPRSSSVGPGSFVGAGVIVGAHTRIGEHVFLNRGALIGHHTVIGNHVSIMPGANIAGACSISDSTYIGMGAIVIDHLTVGAHSVVGAGSVVTKNVPDNVQVVGNPARVVKNQIDGK